MLKRRQILLSLGAAGLVAGPTTFTKGLGLASAQGRPLTFCSWGGALSELEKTTMLDPFARAKRIEIAYASPTNYAKIKAMVEGGAPEWDLVNVGGRFIDQGKDLLETLDMSLIPNARSLDPGWITSRGIFTSTGATVMAWNTKAFAEDKGPTFVEGILGRQGLPGPARSLQAALLQLRGRPARRWRSPRPDLSGHRRQDQAGLRETARDQAAREGLVDRRRPTAAVVVERRTRAVLGLEWAHFGRHERKRRRWR